MDIGTALRYYRRVSRMTQSQVAEKADINEKYYGEIERNESSPTINRLEKICSAMGVNMGQIVGYKPVNRTESRTEEENFRFYKGTECYCNCCGTSFYSEEEEPVCPQCGCQYDEETIYIERYQ